MVTRGSQVKMLDFGLAKLAERQMGALADSKSNDQCPQNW